MRRCADISPAGAPLNRSQGSLISSITRTKLKWSILKILIRTTCRKTIAASNRCRPATTSMQVIESDIKPTKTSGGEQLVLTLEVIEGPFSNRRVWDRLEHQEPERRCSAHRAARAGRSLPWPLASTRFATDDLHFKPFVGRLTIKAGQNWPVRAAERGSLQASWRPTARG
jgi:hypothetical protein